MLKTFKSFFYYFYESIFFSSLFFITCSFVSENGDLIYMHSFADGNLTQTPLYFQDE